MNKANMQVLTNIIGAVESGGQVYGKRNYKSYVPPYTNSDKEHTITLGWPQYYGDEAKRLIQLIKDINPANFKNIDNKGTIDAMLSKDWVAARWNPSASQKNTLIQLIDSGAGHEAQDKLFSELMYKYISDCEKDYPRADIPAQMMYCEIRHLGGKNAVDRIFKRCNGYYSLDNILASLKKDQSDKSSDNQVGDKKYWSRHEKCVEFIRKYASDEKPPSGIQTVLSVAESWVGYLEKRNGDLAYLQSKKENAGDNNYTWFGYVMHRLYPKTMDYPAAWCDAFIDFCFFSAFDKAVAEKLLCGEFDDYTVASAQKYKDKGQWYKEPKVGDQIFFKNDVRICHTGIVYKVENNKVYTIEGNTHEGPDVIPNGGGVCKKSYSVYNERIAGYGRPDYKGILGDDTCMFEVETVKRGDQNNSVLLMQEIFRARGYKMKNGNVQKCSGKCGEQTEYVIEWYRKQRKLPAGKICDDVMWKDLLALKVVK